MVEKTSPEETPTVWETNTDLKDLVVNLENGLPSDEIESLCMNCHKQGMTRFMYTKIPMFKEIILSSFACEECGFKNTEVQFGGKLADTGIAYCYKITDEAALNRSIVKSEFATIRIPELDFEIPPQTQKGSINTVEGFLMRSIEGISDLQDQRRKFDPITAAKIDEFIAKLQDYQDGKVLPFTFEVSDPSGNSFIQNPFAPKDDPNLSSHRFIRSSEMYTSMGYNVEQASLMEEQDKLSAEGIDAMKKMRKDDADKKCQSTTEEQEKLLAKASCYAQRDKVSAHAMDFGKPIDDEANNGVDKEEAISFKDMCYACTAEGEVKMCVATIPYFKEIIIMCFKCDACGNKSTEIKQGGGMSEKATKMTFAVTEEVDLNRDVFKSDTALLCIPEIDLELMPGTLGSMYTTIEGLLVKTLEHLQEANPFGAGDSATNAKFIEFLEKLAELSQGKKPFTLILDDPLSNCFIYNEFAPKDDPKCQIEIYERTEEQNDDLGINDMNV